MEKVKKLCRRARALLSLACLLITHALLLASCSSDDYINAIPNNSTALLSVSLPDIGEAAGTNGADLLKPLLGDAEVSQTGLDLTQRIFFFTTAEGDMGCCLKVADSAELKAALEELRKKGKCSALTERRSATFCMIGGSWVAGFTDEALLLMGPVLPAQQAEVSRRIAKYLRQDDDNSITASPLYARLDSIQGAATLVAQSSALPQQLALPFTICAPKGADPSQVLVAASLSSDNNGCLQVSGETFSLNAGINSQIKANAQKLRPHAGTFARQLSATSLCTIMTNVRGSDLVEMLRGNDAMGMLMAGMNTAIDIDNILRCVDGDLCISIGSLSGDTPRLTMLTRLSNTSFTSDIGYWMKSCPKGSRIDHLDSHDYCLVSGQERLFFGVSGTNTFYASNQCQAAADALTPTTQPLTGQLLSAAAGQRFCLLLNISKLTGENNELSLAKDLLKPLFGNVDNILFTLK